MTTCEKCGVDYAQIEATMIETKAKQRRRASICASCWSTIHPGEWFSLPGEDEETEKVMRIYWECDVCSNIFQARGVQVLVRLTQAPPWSEYIVCAACAAAHPELQPKPTQEEEPEAAPAEEAQEQPEASEAETVLSPKEAQAAPEPEAQEPEAAPAPAPEAQAETATQQSGWQTVQAVVETIVSRATQTDKK